MLMRLPRRSNAATVRIFAINFFPKMQTRTEFPNTISVIEHALIPLSDEVTLSAMIWLPEDAEANPVPAILEYLPYRKRDGTAERDALTHPCAGHGTPGSASTFAALAIRRACSRASI